MSHTFVIFTNEITLHVTIASTLQVVYTILYIVMAIDSS